MESHHHHHHPQDKHSKFIGLQTALIAILLTITTILAHRAHTDTIMYANESSNTWSHYQSKRIRAYQVEMNSGLVKLLATNNPQAAAVLEGYHQQSDKYQEELQDIKKEAEEKAKEQELAHHKASFFDLAEGIIEVAMILSSLYFLTQQLIFPNLGLILALAGVVIAVWGIIIH